MSKRKRMSCRASEDGGAPKRTEKCESGDLSRKEVDDTS